MGQALILIFRYFTTKASARAPFFVALLLTVTPARADYLETLRQTDPAEFLAMVEAKADSGNVAAEMVLAQAYERGEYGLAEDDAKALDWYRRAAERRNPDAELAIAGFYQDGKGVPKDAGDANAWLQMAATDGSARALDFLGDSYLTGRGVDEDDARAIELYRRAARQDVVESEVKLGGFYFQGQVVKQDYGAAYYWLRLARANPRNALFPDLDAGVANAAAKLKPGQRAAIDSQVDAIVAKLHPTEVCHDSICIKVKP